MTQMNTPEGAIPLKSAIKYVIAPDGNIWRDGKSLRQQFKNGRWYAQVYRDDGRKWVFDSDKMVAEAFGDPTSDHLTREDILGHIGARIIPEWPRYAATSYGAVYCISPPVRGRHAGRCYALSTRLRRDRTYVTLYDDIGRRRYVSTDAIVDMISS